MNLGWLKAGVHKYIHVAEQTETSCVSHIKVTRELTGDLSKT